MEQCTNDKIEEIIDEYRDDDYFVDLFLDCIDKDKLIEKLTANDIYESYGEDILDAVPDDEIMNYVKNSKMLYPELSVDEKILSICNSVSPNSFKDKDTIKKIINDKIDFYF